MKLNIEDLTRAEPFCAGVLLRKEEALLVTLNEDHLPAGLACRAFRVGCVGGGQEMGETILQCALREGQEETSSKIELISSDESHLVDFETGQLIKIEVSDKIKPFLFEKNRNPTPEKPYKRGLPTGPFVYGAVYQAVVQNDKRLEAGDDVIGLLWIEPSHWPLIENGSTLRELINNGADLISYHGHTLDVPLWAPDNESTGFICRLLSHTKKTGTR
ncbi:NUDIX domain-containing protein [Bacillus sp. 1P06AnD]|uniref:NUDIX domain-containing protein n=1 Tax=Bacillus sp. 1P06AnD TaxID=3132208 RepID=UPI0039A1DDD4